MVAIVVHGGAGRLDDRDRAAASAAGCLAAARAGHAILEAGGSALDAVQTAAVVLEDDPLFNAGTGSALNADGEVENDALVMDGATRRAGGVAALRGFKNPIVVARAVLDGSPHVLLAAEGAARFARERGIAAIDPALLITDAAKERWRHARAAGFPDLSAGGTIGAVAIDSHGRLAAATSTGGITGKHPGRIGDTPLPGCGTYADSGCGAASATGHGESIMRVVMTKHACDRMAGGASARAAAQFAVDELARIGGGGGIICVSRGGEVGFAFNTARMSRAWIDSRGREGSGY